MSTGRKLPVPATPPRRAPPTAPVVIPPRPEGVPSTPFRNYRIRSSVMYSPHPPAELVPPQPPPKPALLSSPSNSHLPLVSSPSNSRLPLVSSPQYNYSPPSSSQVSIRVGESGREEFPPTVEVLLTFNNVCYEVPQGRKKPMKQLLKNVSGYVKAGQILAIMGPSGCGKTTMLNILAGRISNFTGAVAVNGQPIDKYFRHISGYVTQDDTFLPHLTVREQLTYSAFLRLPQDMSKWEKRLKVTEVESELGLTGCSNTKIGNQLVRGVSGGERKRANIGVELLSDPRILFLDEPTSGLDAFTAKALMDTLRALADAGCAVVVSIHQPRADIYAMFDSLMLMSVGEVVYFGPGAQACTDYFTAHHINFPKFANPADHLMDIVTIENPKRQKGIIEKDSVVANLIEEYKLSPLHNPNNFPPAPPPLPPVSTTQRASPLWQFILLFERAAKNIYRDPLATIARIMQAFVLGIIVGWVFYHLGHGQASMQDKTGGLFLIVMGQSFPVITAVVAVFIVEREVFFREHRSGMYRTSTYYASKIISEFPMTIIVTFIQAAIVYWMMGLNPSSGRFFTFLLLAFLISLITTSIGITLSAFAPDINVANILAPVILVLFIIFSGFLRNSNQLPKFWIWMEYLSFFRYGYQALVCNEFAGSVLTCTVSQQIGGVCPVSSGDVYVHDILGFDCNKKWGYVGVLILFFIVSTLLGYAALRKKVQKK